MNILLSILGNPGKYQYFPGNLGKYHNEYNQHTAVKMLKILSKLSAQMYVFYEYFVGCKNTLQACRTSVSKPWWCKCSLRYSVTGMLESNRDVLKY